MDVGSWKVAELLADIQSLALAHRLELLTEEVRSGRAPIDAMTILNVQTIGVRLTELLMAGMARFESEANRRERLPTGKDGQ